MKHCPECGSKVKETWNVCASCGTRLKKEGWVASVPETDKKTSPGKKGSRKIFPVLFLLGGVILLAAVGAWYLFLSHPPGNSSTTKPQYSAPSSKCTAPFTNGDSGCCLDQNANGVCDYKEEAPIASSAASSTIFAATSSSIRETTTTSSTSITSSTTLSRPMATTTTPPAPTTSTYAKATTSSASTSLCKLHSSCANKYGVSSDTIIYVFTAKCCETSVTPSINTAEKVRGYKFARVDAEQLTGSTEGLLKCYLPAGMITVPQLICPATGETAVVNRQGGVLDQILSFSEKCVKSAYA